jgi:excisionase family DNA binding protein
MEGQSEDKRTITAREAATLLGVHYNTVLNRIHRGEIEAEKVLTERGPTWMIDPDSLTNNTPPSDSQQLVGRVPEEALTIRAREIREHPRSGWLSGRIEFLSYFACGIALALLVYWRQRQW